MSLTSYFEEYSPPKSISSETKQIEKRSYSDLLKPIGKFFNEWIQHSYEAWVKAGRPEIL